MGKLKLGDRCRHGLYCKCYLCELEKENARLKTENERLVNLLRVAPPSRPNPLNEVIAERRKDNENIYL